MKYNEETIAKHIREGNKRILEDMAKLPINEQCLPIPVEFNMWYYSFCRHRDKFNACCKTNTKPYKFCLYETGKDELECKNYEERK